MILKGAFVQEEDLCKGSQINTSERWREKSGQQSAKRNI